MHATLAFTLVAMPSLPGGDNANNNVSPAVEQRRMGRRRGGEGLGIEVEVEGFLARKKKRNTKHDETTYLPRPAGSYYATEGQEFDASP